MLAHTLRSLALIAVAQPLPAATIPVDLSSVSRRMWDRSDQ